MRNEAFSLQPVRVSYKSRVIVLAQMQDREMDFQVFRQSIIVSASLGEGKKSLYYCTCSRTIHL